MIWVRSKKQRIARREAPFGLMTLWLFSTQGKCWTENWGEISTLFCKRDFVLDSKQWWLGNGRYWNRKSSMRSDNGWWSAVQDSEFRRAPWCDAWFSVWDDAWVLGEEEGCQNDDIDDVDEDAWASVKETELGSYGIRDRGHIGITGLGSALGIINKSFATQSFQGWQLGH